MNEENEDDWHVEKKFLWRMFSFVLDRSDSFSGNALPGRRGRSGRGMDEGGGYAGEC